ncbi:hypothetical protein LCGC14_0766870 [marine sediment metagenome]|uniref:Uncharacterized protein n=1 Tax=marine sediment metagenome TaxID=412755 RepID=A0A0F9QJ97_9ZZZZ
MGGIDVSTKSEKIGGFDKWEISSAYDTLKEAREILADEKKVAAVRIYAKQAEAAAAEVSKQLNLEKTVGNKLSKMYGKKKKNNPHKKSGGY